MNLIELFTDNFCGAMSQKSIYFSLLVPQKLSIESSINNNAYYQKKVSKLPTYKIYLTMGIISYISELNGVRVMSG